MLNILNKLINEYINKIFRITALDKLYSYSYNKYVILKNNVCLGTYSQNTQIPLNNKTEGGMGGTTSSSQFKDKIGEYY